MAGIPGIYLGNTGYSGKFNFHDNQKVKTWIDTMLYLFFNILWYIRWDTDKTSTDKTSNGQMIDVTKERQDKSSKKKDRQTSTNIDNYQLISVNEIIDISL